MTDLKLEVDTDLVCRICLQQSSDEEMTSIYERDSNDTLLCLYEKIEKCAGIKILSDPDLPHRICKKCNVFLDIAHKFRTICKKSDNYLRSFVCKSTRQYEEESDSAEYLMEYNPDENKSKMSEILQVIDSDGIIGEVSYNFEEVGEYTEMWLNETQSTGIDVPNGNDEEEEDDEDDDDIIELDQEDDNSEHSSALTTPSKTLGISPDGAAVIRVKDDGQIISREKQKHICDICGNTYPRKYALEAHMRRHRNERPFECEICHQKFHLNFQLTRHIRKHTGSRPYTCTYCKRSFADRSTMVKHERIHRNERPYTCDTCGKSFTYSSVLKVHKMTHTGEKPFICGICGKRFSRSHHLRAHLETLMHQNDPRSRVLLTQIKRDEDIVEEYMNL